MKSNDYEFKINSFWIFLYFEKKCFRTKKEAVIGREGEREQNINILKLINANFKQFKSNFNKDNKRQCMLLTFCINALYREFENKKRRNLYFIYLNYHCK